LLSSSAPSSARVLFYSLTLIAMRSALATIPILALGGLSRAAVAPAAVLVPDAIVPAGIHAPAPTPVVHGPAAAASTLPADAASLFLCFGQNGRGGCQVLNLWVFNSYTCYSDNHASGSINGGTVNTAFQSVQLNPVSSAGASLDYAVRAASPGMDATLTKMCVGRSTFAKISTAVSARRSRRRAPSTTWAPP
jgi:hypothetical protein